MPKLGKADLLVPAVGEPDADRHGSLGNAAGTAPAPRLVVSTSDEEPAAAGRADVLLGDGEGLRGG